MSAEYVCRRVSLYVYAPRVNERAGNGPRSIHSVYPGETIVVAHSTCCNLQPILSRLFLLQVTLNVRPISRSNIAPLGIRLEEIQGLHFGGDSSSDECSLFNSLLRGTSYSGIHQLLKMS